MNLRFHFVQRLQAGLIVIEHFENLKPVLVWITSVIWPFIHLEDHVFHCFDSWPRSKVPRSPPLSCRAAFRVSLRDFAEIFALITRLR